MNDITQFGRRESLSDLSEAATWSYADILRTKAEQPDIKKADRTRTRLLSALALRLNNGEPVASLRVTDIADDADLAHGTFYRYFTDRDAAVEVLMSGFIEFIKDASISIRSGEAGSPARVYSATLSYVQMFRCNVGLMRQLMGLDEEGTPSRNSFHLLNQDWNRRVARAISFQRKRLRRDSEIPARKQTDIAYVLGGMVDEFLAQVFLRRDPALAHLACDEESIARLLTHIWCYGAYGDVSRDY